MDIQLLTAGYCTQLEKVAKKGGKLRTIQFPATFVCIQHPVHGIILFDTGYSEHVVQAMKRFPFQLYHYTTPVHFEQGQSAKEQLLQQGIQPKDVKYIILSHFHADHMGGLVDFPHATFICSRKELQEVLPKTGFRALKRAYIPALLPHDFMERAIYVEDLPVVETPIFSAIYPTAIDVFGDGSIVAVMLRGHTSEQFGILLPLHTTPYFFIADACWLSEAYKTLQLPSAAAKVFMGLNQQYYDNIYKLHAIDNMYKQVKIIPCHDAGVVL